MKKRIVIIGGGFAGINLAKTLRRTREFHVTLVDKNNYNFFPPLLYQVATGFLEPSSISYPFRTFFGGRKDVTFWMGELLDIVQSQNKVILSNGEIEYDYLVIATGTKTNFFGLENIEKYAIPMKTLNDALNMRNTLLERIEMATKCKDEAERDELLTMVIAGGGPTGVEVSGVLAEMSKSIIQKEYPELKNNRGSIYLVNGADRLLVPMSEKSQNYTLDAIKSLGVKVLLNTRVVDYDGERVYFKDGNYIRSKNLIWATGVTAMTFPGIEKELYGPGNRLFVNNFNKVTNTNNIYAIGDTSLMQDDEDFPGGHPQLAQVAIQQGKQLAINLQRINEGNEPKPFHYTDKGSMAIIGKTKAVADIPKAGIHLQGFVAWIIWLFVHLFSLINKHDQLRTFYNWSIDYFSKNQDLRMIIRPKKIDK
ncbi:MAG: NAD(P)/FAD-dependent oxidoreductase [Leeuwenhoekiella sp.]